MSLFIVFEGGEGSGKSTQAGALYKRLLKLAIPAALTHEPGGTPLGNRLAHWLKRTQDEDISPLTELLLFNASRSQLVNGIIAPGVEKGEIVICDRYTDSTTAYQGYGRGLDLNMVRTINNTATRGLKPDLVVLLDIPAEKGLARKEAKRRDRFEQEDIAFHQRVREGYLELAAGEPQQWLVVDATLPRAKIAEIIWEKVERLLPGRA